MAVSTFKLHVKLAWWFLPYIRTVHFFALATGLEPDWEKVIETAFRFGAVKTEAV